MLIQPSLRKNAVHKRYVIGSHPIIAFFIERLKICDIIGTYVPYDKRMKLCTEKTLCVLIHNILTCSSPLYAIQDWLLPIDEAAVGLEVGESACIGDDRVGRALVDFFNGRHKDVFFRLALRAIKLFDLDCGQIHQDTTTVTFAGRYGTWHMSPLATYGVNKDHRPDLKQLVLGMSVTADGSIPLLHQIYDGNQTDDRLHMENHRRLRKLLGKTDFIYVSDCKLVTDENLGKISRCGGLFVSVMPRTWKEDSAFRDKVRAGGIRWSFLMSRKNNRKPKSKRDRYYLAQGEYLTGQGYRLYWILSDQKAQQDTQTREKRLKKTMEELKNMQSRMNTYNLKTAKKIREKVLNLLRENHCVGLIDYVIERKIRYEKRYPHVGRPYSKDKAKSIQIPYFTLVFRPNEEGIKAESLTDGVFPLITNVKKYSPKRILEIYKYQPFLEKRHSQLKTWQDTTPVFLKKPERVIAYLHMHVMALMVATLIERQLRLAMKKNKIKTIEIYPEKKPCPYPTTYDIVRLFNGVEKYEVVQGEKVTIFPAQLNERQRQVLELLEIPMLFYR